MTDFDPYAILGVKKDATAEQVKAAARKIYRTTHPDLTGGGNGEAFARARRAEQILLDEEKRQTFDATGDVGDDQPDNTRARMVEVLLRTFDGALAAHINGAIDLRRLDMVKVMIESIEGQFPTVEAQIEKAKRDRETLRDLGKRLKYKKDGDDPISASLRGKLQNIDVALRQMTDSIDAMKAAVDMLGGYSFKFDQAEEMMRMIGAAGQLWTTSTV